MAFVVPTVHVSRIVKSEPYRPIEPYIPQRPAFPPIIDDDPLYKQAVEHANRIAAEQEARRKSLLIPGTPEWYQRT